jgi:DNA-binding CsgD family transcriptional regulator
MLIFLPFHLEKGKKQRPGNALHFQKRFSRTEPINRQHDSESQYPAWFNDTAGLECAMHVAPQQICLITVHASNATVNIRTYQDMDIQLTTSIKVSAQEHNLSQRESEILAWVALGKTNPEIGSILGISSFTVKNHVQRILKKLDVINRTQAVGKTTARAHYG